jgi:hypothetical protein
MDQQLRVFLETARSVIRDLAFSYRPEDCVERPETIVHRITDVLKDGYDFHSGTLAEER